MAIQNISVGSAANDGTGDDLREAFIKINQNFQTLDSTAEQTGGNLGSAGAEVFSKLENNQLKFRRLVAGTNISLSQLENTITIESTANSNFIISGDTGSLIAGNGASFSIQGADAIQVHADENSKTITISGNLASDSIPTLSATLNADNNNIINVNNVIAANLVPTNINNVNYYESIGRYTEGFDMGKLDTNITSILDWVVAQQGVDLGTVVIPANSSIDLGSIV